MKIVDTIFQFPSYRPSRDGICRVRIFVSEKQQVTVLLTELDGNTGPFVTNGIELIRNALLSRGLITNNVDLIEHYEKSLFRSSTFDLISFSCEGHPSWTPLKLADVVAKLGCNPADLEQKTVEDTRLFQEIERLRHAINPFIDLPFPEWPEVIKRKLEIQTGQISKSQLQDLIQAGAKEQDIQRLIKRDLSIIAEFYAHPEDEYICFSEFPVDDGSVDFAIFSGRSRMDVTLIEVKGADYYLLNQDSYENFSQKFNESANQIRSRLGLIYRDGLDEFRTRVHSIRKRVEEGECHHNSFVGPHTPLQVDPNKDINLRCIVIGGRTRNDIKESRRRHEYEQTSVPRIGVETWDSWLMKLSRL